MIDITIATLPVLEFYLPPAAPALIKGHLEKHGFTCTALDLNLQSKQVLSKERFNEFFEFTEILTKSCTIMGNYASTLGARWKFEGFAGKSRDTRIAKFF